LLADVICNNGLTDKEKSLLPFFAQGLTTREIGGRIGISHVSIVKMRKTICEKCRKYLDLHV
jgi:DNA-directed RNA polymerase specialized sigma subunit